MGFTNFSPTFFFLLIYNSVPRFVFAINAVKSLSCVWLLATPWNVACQAPLSLGFPRQEYWSGLPFPSPGNLPDPRIKPVSPALAGIFFTTEPPGKLDWNKKVWRAFGSLGEFMLTIKKKWVMEAAWKKGPEITKTSTGQNWILLSSQDAIKRYTGR